MVFPRLFLYRPSSLLRYTPTPISSVTAVTRDPRRSVPRVLGVLRPFRPLPRGGRASDVFLVGTGAVLESGPSGSDLKTGVLTFSYANTTKFGDTTTTRYPLFTSPVVPRGTGRDTHRSEGGGGTSCGTGTGRPVPPDTHPVGPQESQTLVEPRVPPGEASGSLGSRSRRRRLKATDLSPAPTCSP